jgi:hypothetical protein
MNHEGKTTEPGRRATSRELKINCLAGKYLKRGLQMTN